MRALTAACLAMCTQISFAQLSTQLTITTFGPDGTMSFSGIESGSVCSVQWRSSLTDLQRTNWNNLIQVLVTNSTAVTEWPLFFRAVGLPPTAFTQGLIASYAFIEGSLADVTSNHPDATLFGAATATDRLGRANCAYELDGTNDYLVIPAPTPVDMGLNDFSFVVWFKPSWPQTIFGGRVDNSVVEIWNDNLSVSYPLVLRFQNQSSTTPGHVQYGRYDAFSQNPVIQGSTALNDTNWHQLAVTKLGTNIAFFVDAVSQGSITDTIGQNATNGLPIVVGRRSQTNGQYFRGAIDAVLVYDRALSTNELAALSLSPLF